MLNLKERKLTTFILIFIGLYLFIGRLPFVITQRWIIQILGIIILILGIVMLRYQLKNKIIKTSNEYIGAKIISFLFPIVGLIIYAVNVGKNNSLANGCVKWAIIAAIIYSIVGSLIFLM